MSKPMTFPFGNPSSLLREPALAKSCWWMFVLAAGLTLLLGGNLSAQDKPNIVVIVVDDLGYGDLSSYGATDLRSPNVDQLMKQGMRFDYAYANCPVCSPTRASIVTGRYPEIVGVPGVIRTHPHNNWGYLAKDAVTLPEMMKKAGYNTAMVGKWHLGLEEPNKPNDRGFDFFKGYLGDMMDDYYNHRRHGINYMRFNEKEIDPKGHATDLFTQWSIDYLEEQKSAEKPFFLYLCYNAPHTPIQPPADWLEKVKKRIPDNPVRAKLVALIEHMDDGIGKVLDALTENGLEKETLVIFTSDNGGQSNVGANNGNLRDGKQSMYEGGLRVPTCIRWPGKVAPETLSHQRIMSADIFPTLCEIVGVPVNHPIDGISLNSLVQGKTETIPKRDLFFHRREGGDRYGGMITNAVIRGDWKLVRNSPFEPLELFNLKQDPQEKTNLAQKNRKKFRELSVALRAQIQRGGSVPWQKPAKTTAKTALEK